MAFFQLWRAVWPVQMKLNGAFPRILGVVGVFVFAFETTGGAAFSASPRPELKDFDVRTNPGAGPAQPAISQLSDLARLNARLTGARVDWDEITGAPKWIESTRGFLTGSDEGRGPLGQASGSDTERVTKAFLDEYRGVFGHGSEVLAEARIMRQFVTAHNGLRTVVWQQQIAGVPVFEALLVSHVTTNGELVNLSSHFTPGAAVAASAGTPNRAALQTARVVSAGQAVTFAAQNIGESLPSAGLSPSGTADPGPEQHQSFRGAGLKGEADARLVWLPMNREDFRLCWEVNFMSRARGEMFQALVDARSGEVLVRRCLTENISNASYRVFTNDSPTPMSPGYSSPVTNQPPTVPRVLVVTNAVDTNASPQGWINDGGNETMGNNVDAFTDHTGNGLPDLPRTQGSPSRVFDFPLDLTQDPLNYTDAVTVNLFYWNNWMHDKLYGLGFTEAAGNFQGTNFGRGGLGNDAVEAEAQDGGTTGSDNNASFTTPHDGLPGVMQMYIWSGATPNRDGDLDAQVILHEYTHGLSNRRVGGGAGITALQSRGLGEGWSDFYSLALLSKPSDDPNGTYPEGSYVGWQWYGLQANYYYGIRRYPYCTDLTKNPGTFRDVDPGQYAGHPGIPLNPALSNAIPAISPSEIHNQGEIWCAALWEARANLIAQYNFATGNQLILQLVTDGMNLTPANPTFTQARDAVLQADLVDTGGANQRVLWLAFAKRGLGNGAFAPASSSTSGVVESFTIPDDLLVTPAADFAASGQIGGPFSPAFQTFGLKNTGTNSLGWSVTSAAGLVLISPGSGTLAAGGAATNVQVTINSAAATNLALGNYTDTIMFSNRTSGIAQSRNFSLTVSPPRLFYFPLNLDPGWPRQGQWAFGPPAGQGGVNHGNPDPAAAASGVNVFGVNLNGDYSTTPGGLVLSHDGPAEFFSRGQHRASLPTLA